MKKYSDVCPPDAVPELLFGLPELDYPERLNAVETVFEGARRAGWWERTVFLEGDRAMSFSELHREVHRHGAALKALGVGQGDTVILRIPDSVDLVVMVLAVQAIGAVAMPTYVQLRADDLVYRADDTGAVLLVAEAGLVDEACAVPERCPGTAVVALPRDPEGRCRAFADFLPEGDVPAAYAPTHGEDLCLFLYTSGSTGRPKGACHCHRDMLAVADTYWRHGVAPAGDDVLAGPPSIAFALGFGLFVYFPLRLGHVAVLEADKSPERTLEVIARHRATIFAGVCSYCNLLARRIRETGADVSSLRHAMTGGEPLLEEVERNWFDATGIGLEQFIGTTEMLHCFVTSTRTDGPPPGATLGWAVPGYEVVALDPETREPAAPGEEGLLAARGPTGTVYWNRPDAQAATVINGWNVFQDLVVREEDGRFRYVARHDEMIISAGYNISPMAVEQLLQRHPAVVECGCVPAPDPTGRRGAVVKAYVVASSGTVAGDALKADLQTHAKENGPPYMYPREIEFVSDLPRTINGKIRRAELRERAAAAAK